FQVTPANADAVADLCDRMEGIPLAIELAAARAQVLTPSQMAAQLQRRFDFLVSRKRDLPERQRTLRGALDWSYQLLAPELQRFFARLSVFRGGWTLEAAEAIGDCGFRIRVPSGGFGLSGPAIPQSEIRIPQCEVLDLLAQLRECSLVLTEVPAAGSEVRF